MSAFASIGSFRPAPSYPPHATLVETVAGQDALDDLTNAVDLCCGLADECDTRLLWLTDSPRLGPAGADVIRLSGNDPELSGELQSVLDGILPDILHTHRQRELALVGRAARQAGVPWLVHSLCGDAASADKRELDRFLALAEELSPVVIAPSEEVAKRLRTPLRVEVVQMGVDCERYVPGDQARARRKVGLPANVKIVGCSSPIAGIGTLFNILFQLEPDVHLTLFGRAQPGNSERALIRRLGLDERVHVLGAWAKPELVFQAIDVYFHGPAADCLHRAILAAQACGKPVVACMPTDSAAICPQTGWLAPSQFAPTLLHCLRRSLRSADPETTRRFVLDTWNFGRSLECHKELFHRLAESRNQGATRRKSPRHAQQA